MKTVELKKLIENNYAYSEAIKNLRTNLQYTGKGVQVIGFTSSLPGEGKSDVAYAIAQSFSQMGKKVLLIDVDIRKSVLVSRLDVKEAVKGLSEYLAGQCEQEDILNKTNYQGLDIIFAGGYAPNPAELLEQDIFAQLIEKYRPQYDYIMIDTPPVGAVTDCAIVAKSCDGIVLVIEAGAISYKLLQKVKSQLEQTGTRILGVVLNKTKSGSESYYGKYGKYGRYGKYEHYDKYAPYSSEKKENQ